MSLLLALQGTPVVVAPGTGALSLVGQAPFLALQIPAGVGQLVIAGQSPVVAGSLAANTGALTLAGQAPVLASALNAGVGALALSGQAPVLAATVATDTGALVLTGLAPQANVGLSVLTDTGVLTLDGYEPTIDQAVAPIQIVEVGGNAPYWQSYIPYQNRSRSKVRQSISYREGPKVKRKKVIAKETPALPEFRPTVSPAPVPPLRLVPEPERDVVQEVVSRLRWRTGPTVAAPQPNVPIASVAPVPEPDWFDDDVLHTLIHLLAA